MAVTTLLAVLLLAAEPTAAAPPAAVPAQADAAPRDWDEPPPGRPEDQALWVRLRDTGNAAVAAMGRVSQATFRLAYGAYYQGLDAAPAQPQAKALRARLERAAREADEAIPKQGLRVRTCKYKLMELDAKMSETAPAVVAELPAIRADAEGCVREIGSFASALEPRADALERALEEVDAFLGRAPPRPPPTPGAP